jgi:DNA-binding SARP family transcriptional activator
MPPALELAATAPPTTVDGLAADVFDLFPYALLVCDRRGRVLAANARVREIAGCGGPVETLTASCCSLLGCGRSGGPLERACLTALALAAGEPLPELRLPMPAGRPGSLWVTAAPLYEDGSRVVVQLRPAQRARVDGERLRIFSLGRFRVEGPDGPLPGDWLDQRPGQLLRLLVCERRRVAPTDVIAEAIWPHAGPAAPNSVRHFVHELRRRLHPGRAKYSDSYVVCRRGGYALHTERVWIDADDFEEAAGDGLAALSRGDRALACERLERAMELYEGDFLPDEPYAVWALSERERLRAIACDALRALAELHGDRAGAATDHLERLAEMEPFDNDVHRRLIAAWLRMGRKSRAARHYHSFCARLLREFGERPDFELSDVRRARSRAPEAVGVPSQERMSAGAGQPEGFQLQPR